jgi:D-aminopeptidase
MRLPSLIVLAVATGPATVEAQTRPRASDLDIPIGGRSGALGAITDVGGVEVGHVTLVSGSGPLVVGRGPVRTGVTVVHPRGKDDPDPVFAAWYTLNGNGEMTGTTWIEESGVLEGPVAITNTHSVGVVRDAILQWRVGKPGLQPWGLPVVAETFDGALNDINGFHVKPEHVFRALEEARGGAVPEGNVGGGTGMICHQFKGGIGTASRVLEPSEGGYTVGVLVQCNYGRRADLRIAGSPVGERISDLLPCYATSAELRPGQRRCDAPEAGAEYDRSSGDGSIIVIVATDAPLLPHQLKRIVTRVGLGVGRSGGFGGNGSGDIFLAFSTANAGVAGASEAVGLQMLPNVRINPLFYATVQATEEAILNAMLAADTMTGADDFRVYGLPAERVRSAVRR